METEERRDETAERDLSQAAADRRDGATRRLKQSLAARFHRQRLFHG